MKPLLVILVTLVVASAPAFAGPNALGTLVVHDTGLHFSTVADLPVPPPTTVPATCLVVDANAPLGDPTFQTVWKVYAAFPNASSPRLKGLTWGIAGSGSFYVTVAGLPDPPNCFQIVSGAWPSPPGSIGQSFAITQTSTMVECYWFGGYGYDGIFATVPHATQSSLFVDDETPGNTDAIAGFSSLGFGVDGSIECIYVPPPFGACCHEDGSCEMLLQPDCTGIFDGGVCVPNPCPGPHPTGACCIPGASCQMLTLEACAAAQGIYMGDGTSCDVPGICPTWGACCLGDGVCVEDTDESCGAIGLYFYPDVPCEPNPCPPADTGACCFNDGTCVVLTPLQCQGQGGFFTAVGLGCVPDPCPAVPVEPRSWGRIKEHYR
jgi:hypothetical protein